MTSSIPAALDGLRALAAETLPGLQIGDAVLLETENDFLIVGYENGNDPSVSGSRAMGDLAQSENDESYEIRNLLSVWVGDVDPTIARTRLFSYLDQLDAAVRESVPFLGSDQITEAYITGFSLTQSPNSEGSVATLEFLLHVEAYA